jgi:hypothetical protein
MKDTIPMRTRKRGLLDSEPGFDCSEQLFCDRPFNAITLTPCYQR